MKRVFISYSADSEEHRARVLALAHQLRREGVDARVDALEPRRGGSVLEQLRAEVSAAEVVLAVCSEWYRRSFDGRTRDGGAAAEAEVIGGAARDKPGRVVPVLLEDGASQFVPLALRAVHAVYLPEQLPQLLRQLGATGEPAPPLPLPQPQAPPQAIDLGEPLFERVANVSLLGSAEFVGRTFELSAIRTAFAAASQGGAREPLIVIGSAGIGKTALALQHAYRHQESYDVIWVVRAQAESTIRLDLATLARRVGAVAAEVTDADAEVAAALAWLGANDRWLLIFDDAAGVDVVGRYVPRPVRGHVLVLVPARGADWRDAGKKLILGGLARDEAIDLLLRASGRTDPAGADELVQWLEGHPLMVKLAAALARDRGVSLDVLHRQLAAETGARASQRVEPIVALAVEDARQRSPAMLALVELLAYLAPHEIPIRLLREHVEHLAPELAAVARDDNALARLLDDLARLGMVARDDSTLSVHAAVQGAIRASARTGAAVRLLAAAFTWDADHPEAWATEEELLPHVLAAIEDPHAPTAQPRALRCLLARAAACTWKRGEALRAIEYQRRAIALAAADAGGAGQPAETPAAALAALGAMLREIGELDEAAAQLERAAGLLAGAGTGAERIDVLRELAAVRAARGDLDGARRDLAAALDLAHAAGTGAAGDSLAVAEALSELGGLEILAGRLDDATRLVERALAMLRRLLAGDDHPLVAAALQRAAAIRQRRGDTDGARADLETALGIYRAVYRTDHHIAILNASTELATMLTQLGDTIGAQRLLEQALESHRRLFGAGHPGSAAVSLPLARVLVLHGDRAGARRQLERALAAAGRLGAAPHLLLAELLAHLAELDATEGDLAAARAGYEQALALRRTRLPASSPALLETTADLAVTVAALGAPAEAADLLAPALAEVALATDLYGIAIAAPALLAVARALRAIGRAGEARALLASVIAGLRAEGGRGLVLARAALLFARTCLELGDLAEARRSARDGHELIAALAGRRSTADAAAAILRAEIALAGDEPAAAFGFAARALRTTGARDAIAGTAAHALELAGTAAVALGRRATAAELLRRALALRDTPAVRDALFELLEDLAAAGAPHDAAGAVAQLAGLARSWLADRVFATAALESAQITTELEIRLAVAGAAVGAALVATAAATPGYGWLVELAPILAEGSPAPVRSLAPAARYAGRGHLVLAASTAELPWGTYLLTVRFVDSPRDVWRADVTISNVETGNPFLAGPPARGERFFGRARLLDDLVRQLEAASILLLGPRRAGKTSVLYRLAQLCTERWVVVVVDLHGYSGTEDRVLLGELAEQVARTARVELAPGAPPLLALKRALVAAGTPRVLLLLDEIAILARYPDAALQLRAMSKWDAPIVRVVMAGTTRDLDRFTSSAQRGSSPINELVNRELDQLTRDEARALLEQPVLGRYYYQPAALERLLELGAGRPFFLNALAYLALEIARQEGARVVTAVHAEGARQEAVGYLARWYRELVGELDPIARDALPSLVAAAGPITGEHAEALRSAGITIGPRRATQLDPIFIDWWRRGGNR